MKRLGWARAIHASRSPEPGVEAEKKGHDCARRLFNEERKKQMPMMGGGGCTPRSCGAPLLEEGATGVPHIPMMIIMSPNQGPPHRTVGGCAWPSNFNLLPIARNQN